MERPADVSERSWILLTQATGLSLNDYTNLNPRDRITEIHLCVYRAAKQDAIAEMERRRSVTLPPHQIRNV